MYIVIVLNYHYDYPIIASIVISIISSIVTIHYDADHEWNMIMYRYHLSSQFPFSLPEKAMMRYTYQFDKALQRMEAENVPQSSVTVSAIMSNCKENNDWAQADWRRPKLDETGAQSPPWPFCFGCSSVCLCWCFLKRMSWKSSPGAWFIRLIFCKYTCQFTFIVLVSSTFMFDWIGARPVVLKTREEICQALQLLESLKSATDTEASIEVPYLLAMTACARARQRDKANELLQEIRSDPELRTKRRLAEIGRWMCPFYRPLKPM